MATTVVLAVAAVMLSLLWKLATRRPQGLPPGPGPALPLLGHVHLLERDPRAKFRAWRRQYGDVFSLYMGNQLVVVLNGFPVIKEALVNFADVFSDRPKGIIQSMIKHDRGLAFTSGAQWKEQRKAAVEILRQLGMGQNALAGKIQDEITGYIRAVADLTGSQVDLHSVTAISVANNVGAILTGKRYRYDDKDFLEFLEKQEEDLRLIPSSAAMNFLPFLGVLGLLPGDPLNMGKVRNIWGAKIKSHKETYQQGQPEENFIHAYLTQISSKNSKGVPTTINEENLVHVLDELFKGGFETASTTLRWALLYFLHYPHVQDTCYQEVCDVIGTDHLPSMQDSGKMTYVEATLMEVLRIAPVLPVSVFHATASDVTFRGHVIPKDAVVLVNHDSVLLDPDVWGDPDNFRPDRFIAPDGSLIKPVEFIPFGIGRRKCLGEPLARMELFLYLTTLIQNFRFLPADPEKLPSLCGVFGFTCSPAPFKLRVLSRHVQ